MSSGVWNWVILKDGPIEQVIRSPRRKKADRAARPSGASCACPPALSSPCLVLPAVCWIDGMAIARTTATGIAIPQATLILDVLEVVFNHLIGDQRTLMTCRQVCHSWRNLCFLAFMEETTTDERTWGTMLLRILKQSPTAANYVQTLAHVAGRVSDPYRGRKLAQILPKVPRLRCLHIFALDFTQAHTTSPLITYLPSSLQSLEIIQCSFQAAMLVHFPHQLPRLRTLFLSGTFVGDSFFPELLPPSPFVLDSLVLQNIGSITATGLVDFARAIRTRHLMLYSSSACCGCDLLNATFASSGHCLEHLEIVQLACHDDYHRKFTSFYS